MAREATNPTAKTANAPTGVKPCKAIAEKQTKAQIILTIAEHIGVAKTEVAAVLSSLTPGHLMKKGSEELVIPEVGVKLRRLLRPATKARKGRNPITGEEITIKAKPATVKVKAVPFKAIKEFVL